MPSALLAYHDHHCLHKDAEASNEYSRAGKRASESFACVKRMKFLVPWSLAGKRKDCNRGHQEKKNGG